ncbi:DUF413 domain-containing protein [Agaribacterium haliotis]|uniref:DUF413 domain-containing protein n=1 Tax=Agaribacterium haliotis TaxID=2013869 RepID=UPI0011776E9F|nr:DUF413 domain-containing protein [Agaribacterium haliotis]
MSNPASFHSSRKFYANDHYPYGLARSGDYNSKQSALLENCGQAYAELSSGKRKPVNDEEQRFVLVCKGELCAESEHELAWLRFCQKTDTRLSISAFGSQGKQQAPSNSDNDGETALDLEEL